MSQSNIGNFSHNQKDLPPVIEFFVDTEEDREATLKARGALQLRDVHMVQVRQRGSRDFAVKRVSEWLVEMENYSQDGRQPHEWAAEYQKAYDRWKNDMTGEHLQGYDLRKWPGISKAQLHNLRIVGILTVEDVAQMNAASLEKAGIGAVALKSRAQAWLEANKGTINPEEVAQLRDKTEAQAVQIADLMAQMATLSAAQPKPAARGGKSGD